MLAETYGLHDNALFQTQVQKTQWQEQSRRWRVTTNRGDAIDARFVVHSNGPLNRPKLPGIAGIDRFKGHTFHTSRWDYNYTGGDSSGNLDRLANKRVAVIGTGATAVQCIPHLAQGAEQLYVFQRCLLYTSPSPRDKRQSRMPSSA